MRKWRKLECVKTSKIFLVAVVLFCRSFWIPFRNFRNLVRVDCFITKFSIHNISQFNVRNACSQENDVRKNTKRDEQIHIQSHKHPHKTQIGNWMQTY